MHIYLDIETIPTQRADVRERIAADVSPPASYKKADSIAKWHEEHGEAAADEEWRKTALSGDYGEIVVACVAVDDGPVQEFVRHAAGVPPESDLLADLFAHLESTLAGMLPVWCGHNIGFDLRFLHHRCVVAGVRPTVSLPYNAAPWQGRYVDTMFEWCGAKGGIKLTTLCDVLGIHVEDQIDGSQVWDTYSSGDVETVVQHCRADVERVRAIHKRLMWRI